LILFAVSSHNVGVKVIVTSGPSYEPIDDVRRLTNFSTGELGTLLGNELAAAGCDVFLLRGEGSTFPDLPKRSQVITFQTNDHLFGELQSLGKAHEIAVVLHAAALCDFKVREVTQNGQSIRGAKLESRSGSLALTLEPARKILPDLRKLFPGARIVGWKYEMAGSREEAFARAWRQIDEAHTDACVLNGRAYGAGFAFCERPGRITELGSKSELARFVAGWVTSRQ
jgi:phosphopantothenoylcysteine decarboxylase/phosphopantothenate--cysteine ligase